MEIKAFKAFRFNEEIVGDVGSCIAPPYDVINTKTQDKLYAKNEYNIVRIIKGKTDNTDNDTNNQYTRAAQYLNQWIEKQALKQDSEDNIYAYVQDFEIGSQNYQRSSFISLGEIEEFGKKVKPHEQTLSKPKIDRLNLQMATNAKFGLVFMLYEDPRKIADKIIENAAKHNALIDFVDEQQARHRLFKISSEKEIDVIKTMMHDKTCIIADGHHRYETALELYRQKAAPQAKYQLFAFVNTYNEGLKVLATHRLVAHVENFKIENLLASLKENFEVTEIVLEAARTKTDAKQEMLTRIKNEQQQGKNAFGIYAGGDTFYIAVLKNTGAMDSMVPDKSHAWKSLDVSVLHKLILEKLLDIDEQKLTIGDYVEYVKDADTAIEESLAMVDSGKKQMAFFTNAPAIDQVKHVADAGEKMPQKSTYFYPKLYTGLTIYKM